MEILTAPEVTPMPYGILSVANVDDNPRAAARGYMYQTICGNAVNFVGAPCDAGAITTSDGTATLVLPEGFVHEVTVDWGDGTPAETYQPDGGEIVHVYDPLPDPAPDPTPTFDVTVTGVGGSYEVAGLDPYVVSTINLAAVSKQDTGQIELVNSIPFALHAQAKCSMVGADPTINAMQKLVAAEAHVIEGLLSAHATPTEQAAMEVRTAVAFALATWFEATDGARPILHINAALLGFLDSIGRHGNHLETKSGVLVSAGTGYPTDRIMLSSSLAVRRGQATQQDIPVPGQNEYLSFAERQYAFDTGCHEVISQSITPGW